MIDVAYLAYYNKSLNYDITVVKQFIETYNKFPSGMDHNFVIIAKHWNKKSRDYKELMYLAKKNSAQILELPDDGLDFGAYFRAAKMLTADNIFFLGSRINLCADNWLKFHYDAFMSDSSIKIAAPMGSFEQGLSKIYPNPHIRTCAFMVDRKIFCEFSNSQPFPKTKEDTWQLEHCENSLTNFILKNNYKAVVVDNTGKYFDVKNAIDAKTHFHPQQEKFTLMSDKWDKKYIEADLAAKLNCELTVWGKNFTEFPQNFTNEKSDLINIFLPIANIHPVISSKIIRPILHNQANHKLLQTDALRCNTNDISMGDIELYAWVLNLLDEINAKYIGFNQIGKFLDVNFELENDSIESTILFNNFEEKCKAQNDSEIYDKIKEYDIIVPKKQKLVNCKLFQQYDIIFSKIVNEKINNIILNISPEYKEAIEETLLSTEIYNLNVFLMKKEFIKEFITWLTKIINELKENRIYSKYKDTANSIFQSERFFNIWLNAHKDLKIKETPYYKVSYETETLLKTSGKKQ